MLFTVLVSVRYHYTAAVADTPASSHQLLTQCMQGSRGCSDLHIKAAHTRPSLRCNSLLATACVAWSASRL
jgi:hypothetical protein